jgi:hypothetical protein
MPIRSRKPNEIAQQVMPLMLLGVGLIASNRYFTVLDDEARTLASATQSARELFVQLLSGVERHGYSSLYDILLHFWLRLARDDFEGLRILPLLFFLLGLFLLARAARRLGGPASALAVAWLGVLWPFGFHYGRLESGYAFSFFLIAALTLSYLRYVEEQTSGRWAALFLAGAILIWTHPFGLAVLVCLGIDQWLRRRQGESSLPAAPIAGMAVLWCAALVPLFRALQYEFAAEVNLHYGFATILANAAFCVYTLFVSESVAPWRWVLGVPAGLAVVACAVLVVLHAPRPARRFLSYGALLIALMAVAGILSPEQLMLIAPWVLLPAGVAFGANKSHWARMVLPAALLIVGGIGWYGAYSRSYYAEQSFLEPWPQVADVAAGKIRQGATVISDKPALFFYLTYALRESGSGLPWKMTGLFPDQVHHPQVKSAAEWMAAGHPIPATAAWVRGITGPADARIMADAAHELDRACGARTSRLMMRDNGYDWRQRVFHEKGEMPWRIEVREYDCASSSSQEILHIPVR